MEKGEHTLGVENRHALSFLFPLCQGLNLPAIYSIAFHPDGTLCVAVGSNGTIYLLDVTTWTVVIVFISHTASIWSVCFSPDGRDPCLRE